MRKTVLNAVTALPGLLASAFATAEPPLHGDWRGNDAAAEAIFETFTIDARRIAWGSPDNPNSGRCETGWRLVVEGAGETFHGELYARGGRRYEIFTLALDPVDCAQGLRYLQFALPTDVTPPRSSAEVVSFDQYWSLTGAHNFSRVAAPSGD